MIPGRALLSSEFNDRFSLHGPPLHRPEENQFVHAQPGLVTARGARIARGYELPHIIKKSVVIDFVSYPMLIDQVAQVFAPRIASRRSRGACGQERGVRCSRTRPNRYGGREEQDGQNSL
jgi:hypothetical protein